MGRKAKYEFQLADGRFIGYGFKKAKGHFTAVFRHPTEDKYVQHSTGVEVPKKWKPHQDVPNDARIAAAKAVVKWYNPTMPDFLVSVFFEYTQKDSNTMRMCLENLHSVTGAAQNPAH